MKNEIVSIWVQLGLLVNIQPHGSQIIVRGCLLLWKENWQQLQVTCWTILHSHWQPGSLCLVWDHTLGMGYSNRYHDSFDLIVYLLYFYLLCFVYWFQDKVFLTSSGWPWDDYDVQADLKLTILPQPQPPETWDYRLTQGCVWVCVCIQIYTCIYICMHVCICTICPGVSLGFWFICQ